MCVYEREFVCVYVHDRQFVCVCARTRVCVCRGHKQALDPSKLELQVVVSHLTQH